MQIAVIGLNHQSAPIKIREQVAFTESKKVMASGALLDQGIDEVVILSTCNRSEIYVSSEQMAQKRGMLFDFFENLSQLSTISDYLFFKTDEEAVMHLLKVSTGLNSIVLGEDQILGQVKTAHETALGLGASKKILNRLFQTAIETAKEVKTKTKISENPLSMSSIAVRFLKEKMGGLVGKKVMLIGTGEMSRLALNYLMLEGVSQIYLASQNHEKKQHLIDAIPMAKLIDYEDRYRYLTEVDLVLSATGAPHLVIKRERVAKIKKPLMMMDIALPRDIDPKLSDRVGVTLYNIDQLQEIREVNELKRGQLAKAADDIIASRLKEFFNWLACVGVDATIAGLNEQCERIKEESLAFLLKKIDLAPKQQQLIDSVMMNALGRLMRAPILNLKQLTDKQEQKDYLDVTRKLFDLKE